MNPRVQKLMGANMDIDFSNREFGNSQCPWDADEPDTRHKCCVKNTSICPYFCGIQYLDSVLCSYPFENRTVLTREEMDRPL
ncbi:MAG: hypothetical protein ACI4MF_07595 [Candidatus Faecivicinus sp.]